MRYIKNLTQKEIDELTEGFKHGEQFQFRNRCQAILLSYQGYKAKELSTMFKVGIQSIYHWFDRWEHGGLVALKNKEGQGRKRKLCTDNQEHIQVAEQGLEDHSDSIYDLRDFMEVQLNAQFSYDTVRRFLKKAVIATSAVDKAPAKNRMSKFTKRK